MPLIKWDSSYNLDIAKIDMQHQKLVRLINELHDAMLAGKAKDKVGNIIFSLVEYTKTHFNDEEQIFDKHGYPGSFAHKQEHKRFVSEISKFSDDFDKGDLMLSMKVMNFLKDWLVKHIKGTDKNYVPFLAAKGVK
jgi:hemerythrin